METDVNDDDEDDDVVVKDVMVIRWLYFYLIVSTFIVDKAR